MIENIKWLGHGSFMIQGSQIIYINPWRVIRSVFHADVILLGHDHYDHFSIADIEKLRGEDTHIIGNERIRNQLPETTLLRPWQTITFDRVNIKAVPAYSPDDLRHPLDDGGLGFVISMDFYDIYYAGDTMRIPEMERIHPDIWIVPIDGDGTMNVDQAAQLIREKRPRWVIPSNWGVAGEGATKLDAQRFQTIVGDYAKVVLPETS